MCPTARSPPLQGAPLPSTPLPSAKSSAKVIVTREPPLSRTFAAFCFFRQILDQKAKKLTTLACVFAHHSAAKMSAHVYRLGTSLAAQSAAPWSAQ
ncbi:hypothetical protein CPLU01_07897 [Colletotrichum plurivorum]|uniref:Uncharacterized protein n=1 Tax=Colletotrichum plurivorum TaxID=2175906 RepID=A0A8H6KEE0_9PEZI|nr:hypothetical protein CPLU01_07897 [Colletotrichum plurivorum]